MRWIPASVFLLLTVLHAGLATDSAGPADSAVKVFRGLQQRLRAARAAGDWPGSLSEAGKLKEFLHDNPGALLEVARAAAHGSDRAPAWDALAQYVRMGQATDSLATSADFASLRDDPRFAEIEKSMKTNRSAVSAAAIAFVLPDAGLLAEDVDYDARRHRFLVTSVREKKIVAVQADGSLRDFARSPDGWPMLAVKVDGRRGVVWATAVAVQGSSMAPAADWGRSAVLCFESKSGKLLMRAEGPPGTALGDLALLHDGDVLASDGEGGGVYRLAAKAGSLVRLDKGDFLSPQTAAVSEDGKHVYVPDYERGIAEMDLTTGHVRWLSGGGRLALNGIDGLSLDHGKLIAVQNGTSPERVVAFTLDAKLCTVVAERILERSTGTLGDPTHGVVVGKEFFYIANSGWDAMDEKGNVKVGATVSSSRIMRAAL